MLHGACQRCDQVSTSTLGDMTAAAEALTHFGSQRQCALLSCWPLVHLYVLVCVVYVHVCGCTSLCVFSKLPCMSCQQLIMPLSGCHAYMKTGHGPGVCHSCCITCMAPMPHSHMAACDIFFAGLGVCVWVVVRRRECVGVCFVDEPPPHP